MQDLIERLQQHKYDYDQGELVLPGQMASDCKEAAEAIKSLQSSKHTQKRARSRLSKKNREYRKELNTCYNRIHELKTQVSNLKEQLNDIRGEYNIIPEDAWKEINKILFTYNIPHSKFFDKRDVEQAMEYGDKTVTDLYAQIRVAVPEYFNS